MDDLAALGQLLLILVLFAFLMYLGVIAAGLAAAALLAMIPLCMATGDPGICSGAEVGLKLIGAIILIGGGGSVILALITDGTLGNPLRKVLPLLEKYSPDLYALIAPRLGIKPAVSTPQESEPAVDPEIFKHLREIFFKRLANASPDIRSIYERAWENAPVGPSALFSYSGALTKSYEELSRYIPPDPTPPPLNPHDQRITFTAPLRPYLTDPSMVRNIFTPFAGVIFLDNQYGRYERNHERYDFYASEARKKDDIPDYFATTLQGTMYAPLLTANRKFTIPSSKFHEHVHVIAGTGAGKTTLLKTLVLMHACHTTPPPTIVVVDSQGSLIPAIAHLKQLNDRVTLISPRYAPPSVTLFDIPPHADDQTREQSINAAIQTLTYLFDNVVGVEISGKQRVPFLIMCRILFSFTEAMGRSATLEDMARLTQNPDDFEAAVNRLEPIQRNFYRREFFGRDYGQSRNALYYKLVGVLQEPALNRLFASDEASINIPSLLNDPKGNIILIDTAKDFLKSSSATYGCVFISLLLQAIFERINIKEHKRQSTLFMIDEAQEYFNESSDISDLLDQARKFNCGVIAAHHHLAQATPKFRSTLATNTSIKFTCQPSTGDAKALAPDFRTTEEFILAQPAFTFATYVKGITPEALPYTVHPDIYDRLPKLTNLEYERFLERNRKKVAAKPRTQPPSKRDDDPHDDPDNVDMSAR